MPITKENGEPNAKLRSLKARSSTIGLRRRQRAPEEDERAGEREQRGSRRDRLIVEPVIARAFLEHVLERAEK